MPKILSVRALRVIQADDVPLYSFYLRGDEILKVAQISQIKRGAEGELLGYQRGEVKKHVDEIADYLDSGEVIFPNSILLAMSSDVNFKQSRGPKVGHGDCQAGVLEIPLTSGDTKAAWIVDGQQRTLALSKAKRSKFPVPITAFVTDDFEVHRSQFLLVNKVKPLSGAIINELLPTVNTRLPSSLSKRLIPATICELMNRSPESPFQGLIIQQTTDRKINKKAVVVAKSLIDVITKSLNGPNGCLYQYRNIATGDTDGDAIVRALNLFWAEVKETFPTAWGLPSTKSRLMHGAGIRAMGVVMDRVMANVHVDDKKSQSQIRSHLDRLKPHCAWTQGTWDIIDGRPWNAIQNLNRDVKILENALVRAYTQAPTV